MKQLYSTQVDLGPYQGFPLLVITTCPQTIQLSADI